MQPDRTEQTNQQNVVNEPENNKKNKKSSKNSSKLSINVQQQVVYNLILSINKFSNLSNLQTEQKTQIIKQNKFQLLQRNGIKRSDINQIIVNKIKPIPYNNMNDVRMKVRACLGKVYLNKKHKQSEVQQLGLNVKKSVQQLFTQSINAYIMLSELLRQASISTPIQEGFYQQYCMMWQQFISNAQNSEINVQKQRITNFRQQMLSLWNQIPHQSLSKHLQVFKLQKFYGQIEQQIMIRIFTSLMVDNKIQQCCTYYEIFCLTKNSEQIQQKISPLLRQFQDEVLIPKITKSDHIFSSHVLSLLKSNTQLKQRLLNSIQLDPAVGVRIIDLLKQDGRRYYNIYIYCLKQHYKSIVYQHKYWWMVEDKLSFNKNFIQWYAQDLTKALSNKQDNDKLSKIAKQIKNIQNVQDLELSILQRNKVIDFQHSKFKNKQFVTIPNPLFQNDRFDCAEILIEQACPQDKEYTMEKYLRFQQFGVQEQDIKIIDKIDQSFKQMCNTLLNYTSKPIGFDTEFRCVSTKYQQQGVSLIQLSTQTQHYIIDFLKIQNQPEFNKFIIQLLCSQDFIKVGHTISSDIRYLTLTLHIPEHMTIKSFIDISQMFKALHPNEKYSSLSFLCLKFLNRKLSKYQQRSNWNRRPLKSTQIHYAALDAFACVLIYDKLIPEYVDLLKNGKIQHIKQKKVSQQVVEQKQQEKIIQNLVQTLNQTQQQTKQTQILPIQQILFIKMEENNFVGDIYRSDSLIYHKKYQNLLSSQEPKFLIDNMLKKLSNVMRNCGLDAEFIAVRDYQLATALAQKQNRIILTRDSKFFQRKDNKIPIYLIKQRTDSDKMFEQVKQFFKLDLSKFETLSRCVKCNGPQLIIITKQQALNEVKWKYEDTAVNEFWRCTKCKQIYWQGGQFQRAKQKYANLKK